MNSSGAKKSFDVLTELATRLPWWASLLSALASYVLLNPIATLQLPAPIGTVDLVATALGQLFVFLAQATQFLLPPAFLISAAVSGFNGWKRNDLRESVTQDTTGSILRGLPWPDFSLLVSEAFRRRGYALSNAHTGASGRDTMLELARENRRYLVDCADWRSWKAGAGAVRKLSERVEATDAHGGFAVTSGQFTPEAKHFAADRNIELVDGRRLKELVRAAPERARDEPSSPIGWLSSLLARWRESIRAERHAAKRTSQAWDPQDRASIARPPVDGSTIGRANQDPPATDNAEIAAAAELAALIRAERGIDERTELRARPVQGRGNEPRRPKRPKRPLRPRKIADVAGMLLALVALLGVYHWFSSLPDSPTHTPWALLGAGRDSEVLARRLEGLQRSDPGTGAREGGRPLGQFQFGPAGRIADLQATPEDSYNSLRELEAAFEDKYVPPPECFAWESNDQMVKCGNHRIRARRAFIQSGGEVAATMLGSWEEPRAIITELRPGDWREYDHEDWQEGVDREWGSEPEGERGAHPERPGGWDPDPQPYGAQDSAPTPDLDPGYVLEPDRDWQPGQGQDPRRAWQGSEIAETAQTTWDRVDSEPSRDDWRSESNRDWRQAPAREPALEPQQDWRRDWLRAPEPGQEPDRDWRRDWIEQPQPEPEQDWRQDWGQNWLQSPQQEPDRDWQQTWDSEPAPVERRHWVDDR